MLLAAVPVWAQGGGAGGVFLDPDKVLRWTDNAKGKNATKMKRLRTAKGKTEESADLAYVSLPSLCREAKKLLDAGEKLPPEMKNLGGITQLRYIFVYPETKDLVIAGPAEDPAGDDLIASSGPALVVRCFGSTIWRFVCACSDPASRRRRSVVRSTCRKTVWPACKQRPENRRGDRFQQRLVAKTLAKAVRTSRSPLLRRS